MAQSKAPLQVSPGKGLGFLLLGGSLHDILIHLKAQPNIYPAIELSYASREPLAAPVVLSLPQNGVRLRFDGPDQRLRLIEVLDFKKIPLTYKGEMLVKPQEGTETPGLSSIQATGPAFRQVYHKLFGPTFAGEYFPPSGERKDVGTYVLSYPGVAISFSIQHSAWSPKTDFVTILSSAASAANCLTIFNGASWKDARQDYMTRPCPNPRSLALVGRGREGIPDEIELIRIKGRGHLEILRRSSPAFNLLLSETTPQDLVSQLGPPDAIYRKYDRKMSIHKDRTSSRSEHASGSPGQLDGYSDTDKSSAHTTTDYSSPDEEAVAASVGGSSTECFYNYFHHGFDVFLSYPATTSPEDGQVDKVQTGANAGQMVATKVILHGNVPGSYSFNRYRRSRWRVDYSTAPFTSEECFSDIAKILQIDWESSHAHDEERNPLQRPMVLNRDWGDSPASSFEFADLKSSEDGLDDTPAGESSLGNTHLYGFPGLLFEILKNDAVSCLTIY